MKLRLLIITSHPIQYQAPWFRALHADGRLELDVLFLALPDPEDQGVGFGNAFEWDVPLLEGYRWQKAKSSRGRISDGRNGLVWDDAHSDIRAMSPDVVLITGWQNRGLLQGIRATAQLGLPMLIRAESNGLVSSSFPRRWRHRWILRHASRVLPIGKANRMFYERLGLGQKISPNVPYFVDNEFFTRRSAEAASQRKQLRQKWGIPPETTCFLFAGKLVDKKKPDDLLKAMVLLAPLGGQVHLLLVGAGPMDIELREFASKHQLPVSFAGFLNQTEIPAAYAASDCLVLPSNFGETWGLVVNEAMACGLPAIVSDRVGCGPDLVTEPVTGFCFKFGDIAGLARALHEFCNMNESSRRAMGQAAHQRVLTDYSLSRASDATVLAALEAVEGSAN